MRHGIDSKTHSQCQRRGKCRHGIDFQNPFTMSKIVASSLAHIARPSRRNCRLHLWNEAGGAYRDRTDDLKLAKQALSQLS